MLYLTALQEGLLYGLLALGVYISLRVLDIPDLTTEGSLGFGSALAAVLAAGGHTYLSLPIAFLGGMAAGLITGLLQTKLAPTCPSAPPISLSSSIRRCT